MTRAFRPNVTKGKRRAGQFVGYLRVSSLDQKELRQLEGVTLDKRFPETSCSHVRDLIAAKILWLETSWRSYSTWNPGSLLHNNIAMMLWSALATRNALC